MKINALKNTFVTSKHTTLANMLTVSNVINVPLIDSFSLQIPFKECEIIDQRLTSCTLVYYADLDVVDDELQAPKPIKICYNGITVRVGLSEIPIWNADKNEKIPTKFIRLTVTAKLLKHRYFEGITKENIQLLYEEFISFKIFYCTYDTFLDALAGDVDICINRYAANKKAFSDALDDLFAQCGTKQKWLKLFADNKFGLGLQFHRREYATPTLPHIKLYHKEIEMMTKESSIIFWNTYLFPQYGNFIKNLTRIECTIKNYDHKRRLEKFGVIDNFKSLRELLDIPQKDLYKFVVWCINSYIETKTRVKAADLSPQDHMLFEMMQTLVFNGHTHDTILAMCIPGFKGSSPDVTKNAKSRMKKKLTDLFDLLIHKDLKIQSMANHNKHVIEYLNFLQIKL